MIDSFISFIHSPRVVTAKVPYLYGPPAMAGGTKIRATATDIPILFTPCPFHLPPRPEISLGTFPEGPCHRPLDA